jgi:hypothetical protein
LVVWACDLLLPNAAPGQRPPWLCSDYTCGPRVFILRSGPGPPFGTPDPGLRTTAHANRHPPHSQAPERNVAVTTRQQNHPARSETEAVKGRRRAPDPIRPPSKPSKTRKCAHARGDHRPRYPPVFADEEDAVPPILADLNKGGVRIWSCWQARVDLTCLPFLPDDEDAVPFQPVGF